MKFIGKTLTLSFLVVAQLSANQGCVENKVEEQSVVAAEVAKTAKVQPAEPQKEVTRKVMTSEAAVEQKEMSAEVKDANSDSVAVKN